MEIVYNGLLRFPKFSVQTQEAVLIFVTSIFSIKVHYVQKLFSCFGWWKDILFVEWSSEWGDNQTSYCLLPLAKDARATLSPISYWQCVHSFIDLNIFNKLLICISSFTRHWTHKDENALAPVQDSVFGWRREQSNNTVWKINLCCSQAECYRHTQKKIKPSLEVRIGYQ